MPTRAFRPQLNGLRAFAVTSVVFAHLTGLAWAGPLSHQAVRLFFVLSGFLITGILLDARESAEGANPWSIMRSFYARRVLRIFPAYFLLLGLTALVASPHQLEGLPWFLFYAGNFFIARLGEWPSMNAHLWTLAVEEQFYLVWPLAILFTPRRRVPVTLGLVIAGSIFSRVLTLKFAGEPAIWVLPWASFDALGGGALLAWFVRRPASVNIRPAVLARVLVISLPILLWADQVASLRASYIGIETLGLLPLGCAILGAHLGFGGVLGTLLDNRVSLWVGRISYGIYLYHLLVGSVLHYTFRSIGLKSLWDVPLVPFSITFLATVVVATGSWLIFEQPILRLKALFPQAATTVAQSEA